MKHLKFWFITDFCGIKSFGQAFLKACQTVEKVRRKFGFTKRKPSLRGRVARRQPRREGFSPTFAVCVRRRFEPLSLLRRQLPSQGSQTAGNIALSHTRPCRENRKQRHCTDSCRPCVLAEITFSTSCQAFLKACGFQRRRLWSPTAVGEILGNTAQLRHTPCLNLIPSAYT